MKTCHLSALSVIFMIGLTLTPITAICAERMAQVTVSYGDVNLSSPQGIETLYRRLKWAAAEVCGSEPQTPEFSFHAAWSRCVGTALDNAVAQVHSAELVALHAKRSHKTALLMAKTTPEAH
jgi:UrcA family protein